MPNITLTIPEVHRQPLARLLALPEESVRQMIEALRQMEPTLDISNLAPQVAAAASLAPGETEDIFRMLQSLYLVRAARGASIADFVDALCRAAESLNRPELKPKGGDWSQFKQDLKELLSLDQSLGLSAKAVDVRGEHQRVYCDARVLTDLRPVFKDDVAEAPFAGVIVHTLRISYHEGGRLEQLFVAMDRKDLEELEGLVRRALAKEDSLRALAQKAGLRCLDVESH